MNVVVDTNVVAYFLLGTPKFVAEARAFWREADELMAPSVWEAEIGIHAISSRTLWHGALVRALDSGVAVYDTLFVELAVREDTQLVTFDDKVLKKFPAIAKRPRDIVRSQ